MAKRARTESSRKRQGRENEEDLKREHESKKAAAKTRKSRRDEAKEDDLLVEREEDSADLMQLRVYALKLESDCQQMRAELTRREKRDSGKPRKVIAEPENQSDIDVELIRTYLNILGEEHDYEWFGYRTDTRQCLSSGALTPNMRWAKQSLDRQNTVIHALENRRPDLKMFKNSWAATFLLKQSHDNWINYQRKTGILTPPKSRSANSSSASSDDPPPSDSAVDDGQPDNNDVDDAALKASRRKAALHRSVLRKAAKLKAKAEMAAQLAGNSIDTAPPNGDSATEIKDLPDNVRDMLDREEIGVAADSSAPLKPVPRQKRTRSHEEQPDKQIPMPTRKKAATGLNNHTPKAGMRPIVPMKRRDRKTVGAGRGGPSRTGASQIITEDPEDDSLSDSSGESTGPDSDDD
ncbi:hypothetical protein RSOL_185960, partial [Rhizoctonia solani AG-3 Rhs1AP]